MDINGHEINITKKDKILFPKSGITKNDIIFYYNNIAKHMLPFMENRPLVMERFIHGIQEPGFYQKNASQYLPDWIETIKVKKVDGWVNHVVCNNRETLIYLVNQYVISFHLWLSKINKLKYPDRIIFDIDPSVEDFKLVIKGARALKGLLENELGLTTFVMTTGSKGLHVVVPLKQLDTFEEVHDFAKNIVTDLCARNSSEYTNALKKDQRKGRLFFDYLRNSYAQSGISPFSVRPLEGAPIATPLSWDELDEDALNAKSYNIFNIFKRLEKINDPWKDFGLHTKQIVSLSKS